MATVIAPFMPRRYNHNARGSATAQVTMPSHNPFEQRTQLANRPGAQLAGLQPSGALPGMGHLSSHLGDDYTPEPGANDDPATPTTPATPASKPFDWNSLLTTGVTAAGTVTTAVLKDRYGNPVVAKPAAVAAPSMMPWVLGAGAVGLVVLLFVMKK